MRLVTLLFSALLLSATKPAGQLTTTTSENKAAKYILRDEINIEKQRLLNIDEELNQLRRQRRTLQREINITNADQIRSNAAEIQNQSELLQTQRAREAGIDVSAEAYLNQITSSSRANQEQLEYSIQDTERQMRQLQEQISFAAAYPPSATMTGDPSRQNLQSIYDQLGNQLANLREQRNRLSALQVEQIQILHNDRAYQKSQLEEDLGTLQESISGLRSENSRLEAERVQAQFNLHAVEQQLTEQEKSLQEQQQKLQKLLQNQ